MRPQIEELKEQKEKLMELEKRLVFTTGKINDEVQQLFGDKLKEVESIRTDLISSKEKYDYSVKKFFKQNFQQYMRNDESVDIVDLLYDQAKPKLIV